MQLTPKNSKNGHLFPQSENLIRWKKISKDGLVMKLLMDETSSPPPSLVDKITLLQGR